MAIKSLNNKMLNVAYLEGAESIVISGDGGGENAEEDFSFPEKRVNFYDYDGTLLHTYTWEEALQMTELPPLPTHHEGLTCQEWNYTLEDIKAQDGWVNVGATYIPSDGKTKLHISILNEAELDMGINIRPSYRSGVIIDWGDGSEPETVDKSGDVSIPHTYSKIGKYIISLEVVRGSMYFGVSSSRDKSLFNYPYGYMNANEVSVSTNLLEELFVGNGVTEFRGEGLAYCTSLKNITLPKGSLANTWSDSFADMAIPNCMVIPRGTTACPVSGRIISLPVTMTSLYKATGCTDFVTIPNGIISLSAECFYQTNITSIHLPSTLTTFGFRCFSYCSCLSEIEIPTKVTSIPGYAFDGCRQLKKVKMPKGLLSIDAYAFRGIPLTAIQMPETVESIGNYAFYQCHLKSIDLPEGLKTIGEYAFSSCSISEITVPSTVTSIGNRAFAGNRYLKSANILSESISKNIPKGMFSGCYALVNFSTACEIESLGADAFFQVDMNRIGIPLHVKEYRLSDANLYDIHIPNGVKSLLLSNNHFRNIEIPESVETLEPSCFNQCTALTEIYIPDSVTSIGQSCFQGCASLRYIRLSNNITTIPTNCFWGCIKLSEIYIPANVTTIERNAFTGTNQIELFDFSNHQIVPTLQYSILVGENAIIRVPMALVEEWKAATNWSALADYIVGVE